MKTGEQGTEEPVNILFVVSFLSEPYESAEGERASEQGERICCTLDRQRVSHK